MQGEYQMQSTEEKPSYLPLIVVLWTALFASGALQMANDSFNTLTLMNHFMGFFFLLLAMFKLFNLSAFADGFQMYDLVAKKTRLYAYIYPFIELLLGGLFLSGLFPFFTNMITVIVMAISAAGVFVSMKRGYKFKCACLGTVLNVPLSTVSLVENLGMGAMAALMLINLVN